MSMFDSAKTLKTGKAPKATSVKEQITIAGIEVVAALDVVIKSLVALKKTKDADVKDAMIGYFAEKGVATGARPVNFRGVEGAASASCELRIRSSASALTPDEIELLAAKNIPMETVVDTVETFVINPEYLNDAEIMGKIEAALKKVKGIPEDLFLKQEGRSKTIVGEGAFDALFSNKDMNEEEAIDLLPLISVPAIKPTLDNDDLSSAFEIARKMLVPSKPAKAAKGAKAAA
jgi:hypothetical protein